MKLLSALLSPARRIMFGIAQERGISCPMCTQNVRFTPVKISARDAVHLIYASENFGSDWFKSEKISKFDPGKARAFSKLSYFGLIVPKEIKDPKTKKIKRHSGVWKVTTLGHSFAMGLSTVPKYIIRYNAKSWGTQGERVSIYDCLNEHFSLEEVRSMKTFPEIDEKAIEGDDPEEVGLVHTIAA